MPQALGGESTTTPSSSSSLAALKSYRRVLRLCFKCGAKWSKDHKCPLEVLLAVEAIWDSLVDSDDASESSGDRHHESEQSFLAISKAAMGNSSATRAVRFRGSVQGHSVLVLVDSGSSASFISSALISRLTQLSSVAAQTEVCVAGGGVLHSPAVCKQLQWSVADCSFFTDFCLLPLCSYDIIVGMDWLESFSPMQIHWQQKWLLIPYFGQWVLLQGIDAELPDKLLLQVCELTDVAVSASAPSLHPAIQSILDSFPSVLDPPTGLPPSRPCNHKIPLISGAQPVFIRPYRYPPSLKDEIETQVKDMLAQGLIRPSSSPFSSPVLLVKKKDGSYCFCVDFRQLNAITAKSKYPVPVFDQLIDELAYASWFSTLDLMAGFHQILLQPGEEPKTAFQTHCGQYKFNVMAFGLTGAPCYYRKFIRHFGLIAKPLTDLLRKDCLFIWTSIHDSAFNALKAALCSAPILGIPDFAQPFHLETDASGSLLVLCCFRTGIHSHLSAKHWDLVPRGYLFMKKSTSLFFWQWNSGATICFILNL
jgi:hypothetical protein